MMAFLRGKWWWSRVKDTDGVDYQRSLKTADKRTADAMEALLSTLRSAGETQIINAVAHGTLTPLQVFDAHRTRTIPALRTMLTETDLRQFVDPWKSWAIRSAAPESVRRYAQQVAHLIDPSKPVLLSALTRRVISDKLASLHQSGSTGKRYHAAWSSFFAYLVEIGVSDANPMRSIKAPRPNPSRDVWLDLPDVIRYVTSHPQPFRGLAALREGAGVEIGAALRARVKDIVDPASRLVYIRGSKTESRKRTVKVDAFAWPHLMECAQDKLPDALLFDVYAGQESLSFREQALAVHKVYAAHKAARTTAQITVHYNMHDARHSYAVRHMKQGDRPELIAHNLGHQDASQVIKNYGKYRPSMADLTADQSQEIA